MQLVICIQSVLHCLCVTDATALSAVLAIGIAVCSPCTHAPYVCPCRRVGVLIGISARKFVLQYGRKVCTNCS